MLEQSLPGATTPCFRTADLLNSGRECRILCEIASNFMCPLKSAHHVCSVTVCIYIHIFLNDVSLPYYVLNIVNFLCRVTVVTVVLQRVVRRRLGFFGGRQALRASCFWHGGWREWEGKTWGVCTLCGLVMDRRKWNHFVKYVMDTNSHWAHGTRERESYCGAWVRMLSSFCLVLLWLQCYLLVYVVVFVC